MWTDNLSEISVETSPCDIYSRFFKSWSPGVGWPHNGESIFFYIRIYIEINMKSLLKPFYKKSCDLCGSMLMWFQFTFVQIIGRGRVGTQRGWGDFLIGIFENIRIETIWKWRFNFFQVMSFWCRMRPQRSVKILPRNI